MSPTYWLSLVLITAVVVWLRNLSLKEQAIAHARHACQAQRLQLLDGTVALSRVQLVHRPRRGWTLKRTYRFEYSEDFYQRQRGAVILLGRSLDAVVLSPRPDRGLPPHP